MTSRLQSVTESTGPRSLFGLQEVRLQYRDGDQAYIYLPALAGSVPLAEVLEWLRAIRSRLLQGD